jgi:hypothetical protein
MNERRRFKDVENIWVRKVFHYICGPTSLKQLRRPKARLSRLPSEDAKVAELVDAHDSKSCTARCVGSIPTFGTKPR